MTRTAKKAVEKMFKVWNATLRTATSIDDLKTLTAQMLIDRIESHRVYESIQEAEFKVFSRFGEDGIIKYLVQNVEIEHRKFVECGVEDYTESKTRFLLVNTNWSRLVIDGDKLNLDQGRASIGIVRAL